MPTTRKLDVLLITNHFLALGCATKTVLTYAAHLDRKKFNVHTYVLSEHRWLFAGARAIIQKKKIAVLVTNSICYETGQRYSRAIGFMAWCKKRGMRIVDIAHFSKVDTSVDMLVDVRLFVSHACRLAYIYKLKMQRETQQYLDKYHVLYNPLDIEKLNSYQLTAAQIKQQRAQLGIPADAWVVGRFGRADADKWDDLIIRTLPYLVTRIPSIFVLLQATPRVYHHHLLTRFSRYVVSLPETKREQELAHHIQLCDVLVRTSKIGESFGCAIAEGMYYGKPIIVSSTDFRVPTPFERDNAQLELIAHNVNGYVCQDSEEAARKIILLYANKTAYRRMARANAAKVRKLFNTHKLTTQLEKHIVGSSQPAQTSFTLAHYERVVRTESYASIALLHLRHLGMRLARKLGLV